MLLGPECLPLSVVKQMCFFFALNSQSIDLKDAFFFGSANFFFHPLSKENEKKMRKDEKRRTNLALDSSE